MRFASGFAAGFASGSGAGASPTNSSDAAFLRSITLYLASDNNSGLNFELKTN